VGIFSDLFLGASNGHVPLAPCMSNAPEPCACETGQVRNGHLICGCGQDHGVYAGPNSKKPFWR
jgi:hypothetical protein